MKTIDKLRAELGQSSNPDSPDTALQKLEILYRIEVLECMQVLLQTTPPNASDSKALFEHFQILDGFVVSLFNDRKYYLKYDEKFVKDQETAKENFKKIYSESRSPFRYMKLGINYSGMVKAFVHKNYIAWYQYRETFIKITFTEE